MEMDDMRNCSVKKLYKSPSKYNYVKLKSSQQRVCRSQ